MYYDYLKEKIPLSSEARGIFFSDYFLSVFFLLVTVNTRMIAIQAATIIPAIRAQLLEFELFCTGLGTAEVRGAFVITAGCGFTGSNEGAGPGAAEGCAAGVVEGGFGASDAGVVWAGAAGVVGAGAAGVGDGVAAGSGVSVTFPSRAYSLK